MKLAFLSDTHGYLPKLDQEVDIVFHSGDICPPRDHNVTFQSFWVRDNFYPWFASLPAKHKVFIAGNHDWVFQKAKNYLCEPPESVYYLEHNSITLEGLKIFGSPWQPNFYDWAWNAPHETSGGREFLREKWADVPADTQILITHCPPYGILDKVKIGSGREGRTGCKDLFDILAPDRLPFLKIHSFGHIHENEQVYEDKHWAIKYINAAMVDNNYKMLNKPVIVEI